MRSVNNVINPQIDYTPTTVYWAHLQQLSWLSLFLGIFQTFEENVHDKSDKTDISSVEIPRNRNCSKDTAAIFFASIVLYRLKMGNVLLLLLLLLKDFSTWTRELNLRHQRLRTRLGVIVIQMKLCSNLALVLLLE